MKKVWIPIVIVFALALTAFLLSCIQLEDVRLGRGISGYGLRDGDKLYLLYEEGRDDLMLEGKKNCKVWLGNYADVNTDCVDAFQAAVREARKECQELNPQFEGREFTDERGATRYVFPNNSAIDAFLNVRTNFAESGFGEYNETRRVLKDLAGWDFEACEVPGTDGRILYVPSPNCRDVAFYVLASEGNKDLESKPWEEFYEDCMDKLYPPRIIFRFPWQ